MFFDSKHTALRTRVLYIQHDPTTSCSLNRLPNIPFSRKPTSLSVIEHATEVVAGWQPFSTSYRRATCTMLSLLRRRHATTCLGFCFIYGAWTLITKKGRRLDAEIKRTQNASFHIPAMATSVFIMRMMQSERMRSYNMRTADGSHKNRSLEVQWGTKEIH
jgi:hypothetical protein